MDKQTTDELRMAAFDTLEQTSYIGNAARYLLYMPDHTPNREQFLVDAEASLRKIEGYIRVVRDAHEAETQAEPIDPSCLKKGCYFYDKRGFIFLVLATGPKRTTRKRVYHDDGVRTYGGRLYNETSRMGILGLLEESEIIPAYAALKARIMLGPLEHLPPNRVVAIVHTALEPSTGKMLVEDSNPEALQKVMHFVDNTGTAWYVVSSGKVRTVLKQVVLVAGRYQLKHTTRVSRDTFVLQGRIDRSECHVIPRDQVVPFLKALRSQQRKPTPKEIKALVAACRGEDA